MRDKKTLEAWRQRGSIWSLKQFVRYVLFSWVPRGGCPERLHGAAMRWAILKGLVYTDGLGNISLLEAGACE